MLASNQGKQEEARGSKGQRDSGLQTLFLEPTAFSKIFGVSLTEPIDTFLNTLLVDMCGPTDLGGLDIVLEH